MVPFDRTTSVFAVSEAAFLNCLRDCFLLRESYCCAEARFGEPREPPDNLCFWKRFKATGVILMEVILELFIDSLLNLYFAISLGYFSFIVNVFIV